MKMRTPLLLAAALGATAAMAQVDSRNVPLMPNGQPIDIDRLARPQADTRPYAYQPPNPQGSPAAAPPYYARRYDGDRPIALAPVPPDRSRDLTPFESRSLYGTPSPPRWDIPVRPARPVAKANDKLPEAVRPPAPQAPASVTPD